MSLITVAQLKEHVSSSLSDDALQRVIDGEESDIVERFGPHTSMVEEIEEELPTKELFTERKVSAISSVIETIITYEVVLDSVSETATTLSSDDYEIVSGGDSVRRLTTGTNPRYTWGNRVKITYTPADASAKRILALINLCKLNLQYSGLKSESVGGNEYSYTMGDYNMQREQVLNTLRSSVRGIA